MRIESVRSQHMSTMLAYQQAQAQAVAALSTRLVELHELEKDIKTPALEKDQLRKIINKIENRTRLTPNQIQWALSQLK